METHEQEQHIILGRQTHPSLNRTLCAMRIAKILVEDGLLTRERIGDDETAAPKVLKHLRR